MSERFSSVSRLLLLTSLAVSGPIGAQTLPRLVAIDTAGSDTTAFALPATALVAPVTQVRLRFDLPLAAVPASGFRLVEAGSDGVADTLACLALPTGDDTLVAIAAVDWNEALREATLQLDAPRGLPHGRYRVLACDSLQSLGGLPLDGDGDGLPGGVALRDFAVEDTPLLDNPGFDTAALPWEFYSFSPGIATLEHVALDADGAPASGALRLATTKGVLLWTTQCLPLYPLTHSPTPSWSLRLRHRVLSGRARIIATFSTGFAGDMGDAPCIGPGIPYQTAFIASPTPSFATYDSGWHGFESGFPNGALSLLVVPLDDQPVEILFDDLGLRFDSRVIFRDDFD